MAQLVDVKRRDLRLSPAVVRQPLLIRERDKLSDASPKLSL
jgi:hypothetical protein